jgi:hypothetical protein
MLFHRYRSNSNQSTRSPSPPLQSPVNIPIFQGTDAVAQNQKVALSRVLDVHLALEMQQKTSGATKSSTSTSSSDRPTSSSSSTSSDRFTLDFPDILFADAEVRAFRYFLRLWDPANVAPDPDFEVVVAPQKRHFEETAIKHFFRRISAWEESQEARESMSRSFFRRRRSRAKSVAGKLGMMKPESGVDGVDGDVSDGLKEVTTREGLAQLLWALVHAPDKPLGEKLKEEVDEALRLKYGMTGSGTAVSFIQ